MRGGLQILGDVAACLEDFGNLTLGKWKTIFRRLQNPFCALKLVARSALATDVENTDLVTRDDTALLGFRKEIGKAFRQALLGRKFPGFEQGLEHDVGIGESVIGGRAQPVDGIGDAFADAQPFGIHSSDEGTGGGIAFLGSAQGEGEGLFRIALHSLAVEEMPRELADGVPSTRFSALSQVVDFFHGVGRDAASAAIHFHEVDMGRQIAGLDGALKPLDGLERILGDAASAHVEFAQRAHDFGVARLGQRKPVVVDPLVVEALDLEAELEKAVGAGPTDLSRFREKTGGCGLVARDSEPLEMAFAEFDLGIDIARSGGGFQIFDRARCVHL